MKFIDDAIAITEIVREWHRNDEVVGLVPTMGFFHEGHLALMEESIKRADRTVVSLFVNPLQFGPHEDLHSYPRDLQRDHRLAEETGVDILFSPTVEIMYPEGYQTKISVSKLSSGLCGKSRPDHFDGVATVVSKLFNLVKPDIAVFGQKDYQQLAIIRQLCRDLNFGIDIIGYDIVREDDGLAMSSRNKYLNSDERLNALCLFKALQYAKQRVGTGNNKLLSSKLIEELSAIINSTPDCEVDYVAIVDKKTLAATETASSGNQLALAVYINKKIRLIDNITL